MERRSGLKQRVTGMGLSALAVVATLQTPISAGILPNEPPLNPKFDLYHSPRVAKKRIGPKQNFGSYDAWVTKYSSNSTLVWKKELGTSSDDYSYSLATDNSGNVFISGATFGALEGTNQGSFDAWVAKYSANGALVWTKQLGTSSSDFSSGIATDSSGNVFISGGTQGALGGTNQGDYDAWVAKYSPDGTLMWKQQLGTSRTDSSNDVATDSSGNVLISGVTNGALEGNNQGALDAWVAKYSPDGTLVWKQQLGTSRADNSYSVATDSSGNVFISGVTNGALGGANQGGSDAWVAKYSPDGTLVWKQQLGTSRIDYSNGVATDSSGNVLISGYTYGALGETNQGVYDAWVAKYSSNGTLRWKKQLGTASDDRSNGVATNSSGNVFISGFTLGALEGTSQGDYDAWVAKYSSNGTLRWTKQLGTASDDRSEDVTTDSNGNVFISGYTSGDLGQP